MKLPSSKTLTRHAKDLGPEFWHEYRQLRETYKGKGLTPREAIERAATELQLMEKWDDWHSRKEIQRLTGSAVPMTPEEVKKVIPTYKPPTETRAESVGDEQLTFAEQIMWARDKRAMVENGDDPPVNFPCPGALSWYQYAIASREKFMQIVKSVSEPKSDSDNIYMQDGEYQFKEITEQIEEALRESGEKLLELESGFAEMLK